MNYATSSKVGMSHGEMRPVEVESSELVRALSYLENLVDRINEETARLENHLSPVLCDPFPVQDTSNTLDTTCPLGHNLARLAVQFEAHLMNLEQIRRRARTQ